MSATSSTRQAGRGQALVEFALVTPLILIIIVGAIGVGLLILGRMQMQHAAHETAVAAAQHPSGCSVASARAGQLLGYGPDVVQCSSGGQMVTVRLTHTFPMVAPLIPTTVTTTGRAMIRAEPTDEPVEEPSPTSSPTS